MWKTFLSNLIYRFNEWRDAKPAIYVRVPHD
jgi:hypothetical protein